MFALIAFALQAATVPSAPAAAAQAVPVPMTGDAWLSMTPEQRLLYSDVTVQGLRRNAVIARCEALTPRALAAGIDAATRPGEPLMMAVALSLYGLCPTR